MGVEAVTETRGWDAAWEAALTALEVDVAAAEQMLALRHIAHDPPNPWAPPVGLGPLPSGLRERAQALLERQVEVGRQVAEAASLARRHSKAAQALRATAPAVPVYVDTPA